MRYASKHSLSKGKASFSQEAIKISSKTRERKTAGCCMNKTEPLQQIRALSDFMRWKIALYLVSLAVSGYLIFGRSGNEIIFIILGSFFISCGAYGYNSVTDKEEDKVNSRANPLAFSALGTITVSFSFALGLLMSLFLNIVAVLLAVIAILTALVYSHFRLKKYLFVKNFYTGFTVPMSFVFGAGVLSFEVLFYYFILSIFFFVGSMISDLRDYEGDKRAGIKTIPVYFGQEKAKKGVYLLLAALLILFLRTDIRVLFPLIAALPITYALVSRNKPHLAHFCTGVSLLFLSIWNFLI